MGEKENLLSRGRGSLSSIRNCSRMCVAAVIVIGTLVGGFVSSRRYDRFSHHNQLLQEEVAYVTFQTEGLEVDDPSPCKSWGQNTELESQLASLKAEHEKLTAEAKGLTSKLRLAEQARDLATQQPALRQKAGPFGTVKAPRTSLPLIEDDGPTDPKLLKLLRALGSTRELIVALADSNAEDMLLAWVTNVKRLGIGNYLVVALDGETHEFCSLHAVLVYLLPGGKVDGSSAVSSMKFVVLREFLRLGYSVLLSDLDVVFLQNPFQHLHRDCDVESMSDGQSVLEAYGDDDVDEDPSMGWATWAHTMRIWVYNSGFFYVRPTAASVELLDRVARRMSEDPLLLDKVAFNEELFFPSRPGREGLHASKRTMDMYLFMNSKVLFKTVRKTERIRPVVVHVNYHMDKLRRMKAVEEFYVFGKKDALMALPDASPMPSDSD